MPARIPYPTACAPQAWAAGTVVHLVTTALGLRVDVPAAAVHLAPPRPALLGAMTVRGIRVGEGTLDVALAADGTPTVLHAPAGIEAITP